MLLFCPHCEPEIEFLGAPAPRPLPECEACGGVLEEGGPADEWEDSVELTPDGLEALRDHPAEARRLTADFDRLFPAESAR